MIPFLRRSEGNTKFNEHRFFRGGRDGRPLVHFLRSLKIQEISTKHYKVKIYVQSIFENYEYIHVLAMLCEMRAKYICVRLSTHIRLSSPRRLTWAETSSYYKTSTSHGTILPYKLVDCYTK